MSKPMPAPSNVTQVNTAGIVPLEFKVLILPDHVEKETAGGIIIPDIRHEREEWAQVQGTLIAAGGRAFEDWPDGPPVGATVYFAKYQGILVEGKDGREYRLCNDKDVAALVV